MKISSASLFTLLIAALDAGHAFAPLPSARGLAALRAVDESSAQALSDYMAKSHVEKLKAIKEVEAKKNAEIDALKAELAQLKALPPATGDTIDSPPAIFNDPTDNTAIAQKLASYQNFMEQYMVNAQNQKLLAIREAELKAEKKFQERLDKLLAASNAALRESSVDATVLSKEQTLFEKRNARVVAAAKAGLSRWGSKEVDRAENQVKSSPVAMSTQSTALSAAEISLFDQRNAMIVAAANAGKSRWGSMEIERAKSSGVSVKYPAATQPTAAAETSLFDQRNAMIVASAAAGKSRWGSKEVERAGGVAAPDVVSAPASALAVAKVSLEDRVNLGARLLGGSTKAQSAPADARSATLFDQRNAKVIASAAAGRSRWGQKEVERALSGGVSTSTASSLASTTSLFHQRNAKVVAAANAGKSRWGIKEVERARNGANSVHANLAERVNVGAQLIGA